MLNPNWYLVYNRETKVIQDVIQIPSVWGNATGMDTQSDKDLELFWQWSPHPTISFIKPDQYEVHDISSTAVTAAMSAAQSSLLAWIRPMRDLLLAASDAITVPDRWQTLDAVAQNNVQVYRQALRDITTHDITAAVWPCIPKELDFLRMTDVGGVVRPSQNFLNSLSAPYPALTLEKRQANQWLRIKALRDYRSQQGGVKLAIGNADYWFWTDDPSRNKYALMDSASMRHQAPSDYKLADWKTMSGVFVPVTVAILHQIIDLGSTNDLTVFAKAEMHRQAMLAAADPDSYDYTTGWPQTYQEYVQQQAVGGNTTTTNPEGET